MLKRLGVALLLIFVVHTLYGQSLTLKITDPNNKTIDIAYLRVYAADSTNKLLEYKIIRNGLGAYKLRLQGMNIRFFIASSGFSDVVRVFDTRKISATDTLFFVLQRADIKQLDTVIVAAKRPIVIQNDTTTYNVDSFKDGTERKLQDVLKKLPGIDVNEKSGEIKFKGKPIETVLLEGDNLFGRNYTLGTKNINADVVREVQAIENYSDNYVLKGLEKEEKVVLNIKIAKTKLNLSGAGEVGIGMMKPEKKLIDASINVIGLQQWHKFFVTSSYNNIGQNKSPIDYFGNNLSLEQIKDKRYFAEKFISEPNFGLFLNDNKANFNAQFFSNYNGLYKISKKTSLKTNLYFLNDDLRNVQSFNNNYYLPKDTITYQDNVNNNKKPQTYKVDVYVRNNTTAKALLEYTVSYSQENIQSFKFATSNFVPSYENSLGTKNVFIKNNALYTQRIADKKALQFSFSNTYSAINQIFTLIPSLYRRNRFGGDLQLSDNKKNHTFGQVTLYGMNKSGVYNFSLRGMSESNSHLSNTTIDSLPSIKLVFNQNDMIYTKNSLIQSGNINLQLGQWKFRTSYALTYLKQRLLNQVNKKQEEKRDLIFEPNLKTSFRLSKISSLNATFSMTQRPQTEKYIYSNNIIQSNRSVVSNLPDLGIISTQNIGLNYSRIDLFNQFDNNVGVSYQKNNNDFLPLYLVTDSITYAKYLFKNIRNAGFDAFAMTTKYFPAIRSTVKLSANFSLNQYYNSLNSSELRANEGRFISYEFFYKSIFGGKFNLENTLIINKNISNNIGSTRVVNRSVENSFKIIVKPNTKIKTFLSGEYYRQNLESSSYNLFLDYHLSYTPKKKKAEVRIVAKNLLNNQNFSIIQVSDFSRSVFMTNIIPRNVMLYFSQEF